MSTLEEITEWAAKGGGTTIILTADRLQELLRFTRDQNQ